MFQIEQRLSSRYEDGSDNGVLTVSQELLPLGGCTLYSVFLTLHSEFSTLYPVLCIMYSVLTTSYNQHNTVTPDIPPSSMSERRDNDFVWG